MGVALNKVSSQKRKLYGASTFVKPFVLPLKIFLLIVPYTKKKHESVFLAAHAHECGRPVVNLSTLSHVHSLSVHTLSHSLTLGALFSAHSHIHSL